MRYGVRTRGWTLRIRGRSSPRSPNIDGAGERSERLRVSTGLDVEEAPSAGGIYRAPIAAMPALQVVVGIGDQLLGENPGTGSASFSEALSLNSDGTRMAFWASWGTETFQKTLLCPVDENPDLIAYCNEIHPTGLVVDIPVNQGVFVYDLATQAIHPVALTGREGVEDMLFWVLSGRPPGVGGSTEPGEELALESGQFRCPPCACRRTGPGGLQGRA